MFRRLENNITYFFCKKDFYEQHQTEILFKIITIFRIKMSQKKNKHYK